MLSVMVYLIQLSSKVNDEKRKRRYMPFKIYLFTVYAAFLAIFRFA